MKLEEKNQKSKRKLTAERTKVLRRGLRREHRVRKTCVCLAYTSRTLREPLRIPIAIGTMAALRFLPFKNYALYSPSNTLQFAQHL